jgi:hypothetical protein
MKIWLPGAALAATLTLGLSVPAGAHVGGGASAAAFSHANAGARGHGFGFHHRFLGPTHLFHSPHYRFGAGFASHRSHEVTGGYGGGDYASNDEDYGPYADDDIENLHFRAQEPFGPGDIGRPPVHADADAPYMSDSMDSWHGYEPQD